MASIRLRDGNIHLRDVLAEYRDQARMRRRESDSDGFGVVAGSVVGDARELEGA